MARRIETVGELRRLLADHADNTPLVVAPTPAVNGHIHQLLDVEGCIADESQPFVVILALAEETMTDEGEELVFLKDGDEVQPV